MFAKRSERFWVFAALMIGVPLLLTCAGSFYMAGVIGREEDRAAALARCAEWGRLAPWPVQGAALETDVDAGWHPAYTVSFTADLPTIDAWIAASPGPASVKPVTSGDVQTYTYTPGGGAMFAEVIVDRSTGRVRIRTYWS